MKNSKFSFKNSSKNDFITNLIIVIVSAMLVFAGAKVFNNNTASGTGKYTIIVYAVAIAVAYCKIAVEAIEKLILKRFDVNLISVFAVLVIFAAQQFESAAIVATVYAFCKCIADLISADFSDRILENLPEQLYYNVVSNKKETKTPYSALQEGDKVNAHFGDYLAFSYTVEGSKRVYKAGYFNLADEKEVTVNSISDYEIDFSVINKKDMSKTEKILQIATYAYVASILLFAVFLFVKSLANGAGMYDGLYKLGLFTLFANPVTLNSGIVFAGIFSLISLKNSGVEIKNSVDLEKLSNTKTFVFDKGAVCESDNTLNNDAVKAVRVAEVMKIKTAYLGDENSAEADLIGFDEYLNEVQDEKGLTYVAKNCGEVKNALLVSNEKNAESFVEKTSFIKLVKSRNFAKYLKFFAIFRLAFGIVVNFAIMLLYLSGSIVNKINNYIIEADTETKSLVTKILEKTFTDNYLAPWIIVVLQAVVIIVFMFISMSFIDKNNNKKLR